MDIKLEVGKAYRSKAGKRITIVRDDGSDYMQFESDHEFFYNSDGQCPGTLDKHIVAEWIDEQPAPETTIQLENNAPAELRLEVGKSYRSRDGEKVTITDKDSDDTWPFNGDNGDCYTLNGRAYDDDCPMDSDLIAEWVEPAVESPALKGDFTITKADFFCKIFDAVVLAIVFILILSALADCMDAFLDGMEVSKYWELAIFVPAWWSLRRIAIWLLK